MNQLPDDLLKSIDNLTKLMELKMQDVIKQSFDTATTATSAINHNKPLSSERLKSLIEQMKLYNDFYINQHLHTIPEIRIDLDSANENAFIFLSSYGHKITMPTKTIITKIQIRKNKNKRINKKWLKRYGCKEIKKEVPHYAFISSCGV